MITSNHPTAAGESVAAQPAPADHPTNLLCWTACCALALGCAWALALNLVDPDLWGHVRYAQDWLDQGALPRTASHTYTAVGHPWINHENFAELILALAYSVIGVNGLLAAKCVGGLGITLAMVWVARRNGVQPLAAWCWILLIAANLHPFFVLRPQLLSFGLCTVVLLLLDISFRDWREQRTIHWRPLLPLPAVFALWANTHGAFAAGLAIVVAYLGGRSVEMIVEHPLRLRQAALAILIAFGCLIATLANPYGIELHRWLAQSLSQPRPEITEWASPGPENIVFWPWVVLLATGSLGLLLTRRRRDWVQVVILALAAWQSALHMRHIAFLALLCGFWLPPHLQSAVARLRIRLVLTPWMRRAAMAALLPAIVGLSLAVSRQLNSLPVARSAYPLDAVQFMVDRGLEGKLVVAFNWAQYAIAALAPDVQVAFDGRFRTCYPQETVDMHFDFLLGEFGGQRSRSPRSGPISGSRVLEHGMPDLVLLDRRYASAVSVMGEQAARDNPEWVLLFRDRVAEIWGRSQRYDDPLDEDFFPMALRVQDPRPRDGAVQWPALPDREPLLQWDGQTVESTRKSVELEGANAVNSLDRG